MLRGEKADLSVKDACKEPNPAVWAMEILQDEMMGESATAGLMTEADVVRMIKELRSKK